MGAAVGNNPMRIPTKSGFNSRRVSTHKQPGARGRITITTTTRGRDMAKAKGAPKMPEVKNEKRADVPANVDHEFMAGDFRGPSEDERKKSIDRRFAEQVAFHFLTHADNTNTNSKSAEEAGAWCATFVKAFRKWLEETPPAITPPAVEQAESGEGVDAGNSDI